MPVQSPSSFSLFVESLLRHGLRETLASIRDERRYDREHGVSTAGRVRVEELGGLTKRQAFHSSEYQPVPVRLFGAAVATLPAESQNGLFVDLGCGKGRALILAAEHGYRRLVGVEQSAALARLAEQNVAAFAARRGLELDVRIAVGDAADHRFAAEDSTVFLFHPFGRRVLRRVMRNLESSFAGDSRPPPWLTLVYVNPLHGGVVAEAGFLSEVAVGSTRVPGTLDWAVFESAQPPSRGACKK